MNHRTTAILIATALTSVVLPACTLRDAGGAGDDDATADRLGGARTTAPRTIDRFDCRTSRPFAEDGVQVQLGFVVEDLGTPASARLATPSDGARPVTSVPDTSPLEMLGENAMFRIADGRLHLDGDADGEFYPSLVLYADSGYTRGYVLDADNRHVTTAYGEIWCTLTRTDRSP